MTADESSCSSRTVFCSRKKVLKSRDGPIHLIDWKLRSNRRSRMIRSGPKAPGLIETTSFVSTPHVPIYSPKKGHLRRHPPRIVAVAASPASSPPSVKDFSGTGVRSRCLQFPSLPIPHFICCDLGGGRFSSVNY